MASLLHNLITVWRKVVIFTHFIHGDIFCDPVNKRNGGLQTLSRQLDMRRIPCPQQESKKYYTHARIWCSPFTEFSIPNLYFVLGTSSKVVAYQSKILFCNRHRGIFSCNLGDIYRRRKKPVAKTYRINPPQHWQISTRTHGVTLHSGVIFVVTIATA